MGNLHSVVVEGRCCAVEILSKMEVGNRHLMEPQASLQDLKISSIIDQHETACGVILKSEMVHSQKKS